MKYDIVQSRSGDYMGPLTSRVVVGIGCLPQIQDVDPVVTQWQSLRGPSGPNGSKDTVKAGGGKPLNGGGNFIYFSFSAKCTTDQKLFNGLQLVYC